jgi:hypothetical protein
MPELYLRPEFDLPLNLSRMDLQNDSAHKPPHPQGSFPARYAQSSTYDWSSSRTTAGVVSDRGFPDRGFPMNPQRYDDDDDEYNRRRGTVSTDSSTATTDTSGHSSCKSSASGRKAVRRISPMLLHGMQRVTRQLKYDTQWLRVVHSGYGQEVWRTAVVNRGFFLLGSPSAAEGTYVMIPPQYTVEQVIDVMNDINVGVRRQTRYKDMNRSNKSRLHMRCEPFTVSLNSDAKPELVRTNRFCYAGSQDDDTI